MKYIRMTWISVFAFVAAFHATMLFSGSSSQETVAVAEKRVRTLDLRHVAVEQPKPKPEPKKKTKPKAVPKKQPTPKPEPVPKPLPKPESAPEPVIEPASEREPEPESQVEPEPVIDVPQVSTSEAEVIKATYIAEVKAAIERQKYYPKKAKRLKHEGVVEVRFTIRADGSIANVALNTPSKYKRLNEGALQTLEYVGSFDPIPEELGLEIWEIVVPIEYRLR